MVDVETQDHYAGFAVQPVEYIQNVMEPPEFRGYLWGNVLKYMSRWKEKGKTQEEKVKDLKKARVYLDWLIEFETNNIITVKRRGD